MPFRVAHGIGDALRSMHGPASTCSASVLAASVGELPSPALASNPSHRHTSYVPFGRQFWVPRRPPGHEHAARCVAQVLVDTVLHPSIAMTNIAQKATVAILSE